MGRMKIENEFDRIKSFPRYFVSRSGDIRATDHGRPGQLMKPSMNRENILKVNLQTYDGAYTRSVARLVADQYIVRPREDFNTVVHKNFDRTDCRADNLLWLPRHIAIEYNRSPMHPLWHEWKDSLYSPEDKKLYLMPRDVCMEYGIPIKMLKEAVENRTFAFPAYKIFYAELG